jgi:ACT domain-containing protein
MNTDPLLWLIMLSLSGIEHESVASVQYRHRRHQLTVPIQDQLQKLETVARKSEVLVVVSSALQKGFSLSEH